MYRIVSVKSKRKLGFVALAFIAAVVNADREISGRELQKRMQEKLDISTSLINRERRRMGWVQTSTRYCQMMRAAYKEKRLFFCTDILVQKEEFNDCIFTDDSTACDARDFWGNNLDDSANLPYRSRSLSIHFQYLCGRNI